MFLSQGNALAHFMYDLVVIGGGLSGVSIAAEASARGANVLLLEKNDLADGSSNHKHQLFTGGLTYLEHFEFSLVSHCLSEQQLLKARAPYLIKSHECLLPESSLTPRKRTRVGLALYKLLNKEVRHKTSTQAKPSPTFLPNHPLCFRYHECTVNLPRLILAHAIKAKQQGAKILTRQEVTQAKREKEYWSLQTNAGGDIKHYQAKALINATGANLSFITKLANIHLRTETTLYCSLFLVIPRLYDGDQLCTLPLPENQLAFVLPWSKEWHLIGGIETPDAQGQEKQEQLLRDGINTYFNISVNDSDIIKKFTGRFNVYEENSKTRPTRHHFLELDDQNNAPFIQVSGGVASMNRMMAEQCINMLEPWFSFTNDPERHHSPLPGGSSPHEDLTALRHRLANDYPVLSYELISQLSSRYGTLSYDVLGDLSHEDELGIHFGEYLYEKEVRYLVENEWAQCVEDIVYRRTSLQDDLSEQEISTLQKWLQDYLAKG